MAMEQKLDLDALVSMATDLRQQFAATALQSWTPLIAGSELAVQIGHLAQCFLRIIDAENADALAESGREIQDIGDELADVLLQILSIALLRGDKLVALNRERLRGKIAGQSWLIPFLILVAASGQMIEELMVAEGFRHERAFHGGDAFLLSRYEVVIAQLNELARNQHIDLMNVFGLMAEDAKHFVQNFKKSQ